VGGENLNGVPSGRGELKQARVGGGETFENQGFPQFT